jgi:cytochrome c553
MEINNKSAWFGLAAVLVFHSSVPSAADAPAEALAADIAKGEEKSQVCVACHGQQGISQQDNYPHLHGQQQTYLLRQMHYFRDGGDRRDPIMTPMLENMTDQDLVNLAAYFSSFKAVLGAGSLMTNEDEKPMPTPGISESAKAKTKKPAASSGDEEPAPAAGAATNVAGSAATGKTKSAACAACHGMDGRGTTPLFPNLYGQKPEYLMVQLKAFREGKRADPTMAPMAMALTDQDIADLAAFYGGLK